MTLASLAHEPSDDEKILTIGAVCASLKEDFPSISISKLRYLEDQKLINPKRTPGGYRLYSPRDVERLRTILRLQRDEFLPLRVIRQELAAGGDLVLGANDDRKPATGAVRRASMMASRAVRCSSDKMPVAGRARENTT